MTSEALMGIKKRSKVVLALLLAMTIFISDDTILFGTNADVDYLIFKYVVYLIAALGLLINLKFEIVKLKDFLFLAAIITSIIFTSLFNLDFSGGYVYMIFIVVLAFLITRYFGVNVFAGLFKNYIFFLCLISIPIFVIANYYAWIFDYFPIGINSAGVEFVNLYFGSIYKDVAEIRNGSIFREPGVFAIYILIAIIFEMFLSEKLDAKFIFVAFGTLLTTFSTAAVLILCILIIGYVFREGLITFRINSILIAIILIISILLFSLLPDLYSRIFSKLSSDSASFGSGIARFASIVVNLEIFATHPLLGSGLGNYGNLFAEISNRYFEEPLEASGQSTNSFMAIFATYGLVYGFIILYALMCLVGKITKSFVLRYLLFFSMILMFSSQDMRYSLVFYILVFYGLRSPSSTFSRSA